MHKHILAQALKVVPRETSERTLMSVFLSLCESVNTPKSLAAYLMLKHREYDQLVSLECNPNSYLNAETFSDDYLVSKFLSKYPDFLHENLDPEKRALDSFLKFEEACRLTNIKFRELEEDPQKWDPAMKGILYLARRKIASVLGPLNMEEISGLFGWGPGATTSTSGNHTSAYVKFSSRLDVTSNNFIMGMCCVNSTPSWVNCQLQTDEFPSVDAMLTHGCFNIVRGNEVVFVPKNARTHRVIAKEPHVNSFLQKGFGAYIRKRLRLVAGIDLKDQSVNQRLALEGSQFGNLATIDLSGASDTISYELVRFLLPSQWFSVLCRLRSEQGLLNGSWIRYHKFSSMGNAFTFELESLIFWALCSASCGSGKEAIVSVYGDDLIVKTEDYDGVRKVIEFAGFSINEDKSFAHGPFRESCGKDYFLGVDVRPIFLKERLSNAESLLRLLNNLRRYAHRRGNSLFCLSTFQPTWNMIYSLIPSHLKILRIPDGYGDGGIVSNFDEALPSLLKNKRGWGGFIFRNLIRTPVKEPMRDRNAGYTATLFGIDGSQTSLSFPRGSTTRDWIDFEICRDRSVLGGYHSLRRKTNPTVTRTHTHGWCDLGPWNN